MHKTHSKALFGSKLPKIDICRSIISVSKITHKMLRDHPFKETRQRKARWGVDVGPKFDKGWVGNIRRGEGA